MEPGKSFTPHAAARTPVVVGPLTTGDVVAVADGAPVRLGAEALRRLEESRRCAEESRLAQEAVYGLTTGLGHNRTTSVAAGADPALRERRVLEAHAAGVGPLLEAREVRAVLAATLSCLGNGGSSASPRIAEVLAGMLEAGVLPAVPAIGSVGSADLTAMAAVGLAVCGEGTLLSPAGATTRAPLAAAGLAPHEPAPHDALALWGTNAMAIGLAALAVDAAERVCALAAVTGSLSWHALAGSPRPFSTEAAGASGDPATRLAGERLAALTEGATHTPSSVQDPISLRTMPQVHGGLIDQVTRAREAVDLALAGRNQNPLITPDGRAVPNGNFHPMRLTLAFEALRIALAHVAAISERRAAKMGPFTFGMGALDPGAPGGLADSGVLAYSAAALLGRIRHAASPVSLTCPPLDLDVEDHATMAPAAIALARDAIADTTTLLTIEALLAVDSMHQRPPETVAPALRPWMTVVAAQLSSRASRPVSELVATTAHRLTASISESHPAAAALAQE